MGVLGEFSENHPKLSVNLQREWNRNSTTEAHET